MERASFPPESDTPVAVNNELIADLGQKALENAPALTPFRRLLQGEIPTQQYLAGLRAEAARIGAGIEPSVTD